MMDFSLAALVAVLPASQTGSEGQSPYALALWDRVCKRAAAVQTFKHAAVA